MNKKYRFRMVVPKPTGKDGKPFKPKEIKPKKFSFDDFLKLPRDEQKAIFSIMFRSYGQGPKENVDD